MLGIPGPNRTSLRPLHPRGRWTVCLTGRKYIVEAEPLRGGMIRSNSGIRSARWTPPAGGEASPRAVVSNTMLLHMTMRKMRSIRSNDEIGFPFRRTTITFGMRLMRWHDDTVFDEPKRTPRQKLRVRKSAGPALIFPDSVDSALKPA